MAVNLNLLERIGSLFVLGFDYDWTNRPEVRIEYNLRNPVYLADESRKHIQIKGFSEADLARELSVTGQGNAGDEHIEAVEGQSGGSESAG